MKSLVGRILCCLLGLTLTARAQSPWMEHYGATTFDTPSGVVWAFLADSSGVLLMANNAGVLMFDGAHWRLAPTPSPVRALARAHDGQIMVGCIGDFGALTRSATDKLEFVSYRKRLSQKAQTFGWVDKIFVRGKQVFFYADEHVFRLEDPSANLKNIKVFDPPAGQSFYGAAEVDGALWVQHPTQDLSALQGDNLRPVAGYPGGAITKACRWYGQTYVLADDQNRLFIRENNGFRQLPTIVAATALARIDDNLVAVGTRTGVLLLNPAGAVVHSMTGLPSDDVYGLFADGQRGLWVAHRLGLTRVQLSPGIVSYKHVLATTGKVNDICVHNGLTYLAAAQGLFTLTPAGLTQQRAEEAYCLLIAQNHVLAGTDAGLFDVTGGAAAPVSLPEPYQVLRLWAKGDRLWAAHHKGATDFAWTGVGWQIKQSVPLLNIEATSVVEAEGVVWVGTARGLYRLQGQKPPVLFDGDKGLFDGKWLVYLRADGPVFYHATEGYFKPKGGDAFAPIEGWRSLRYRNFYPELYVEPTGACWALTQEGVLPLAADGPADQPGPERLRKEKPSAFFANGNERWVAYPDDLVRFADLKPAAQPPAPVIRTVLVGADSTLFDLIFPKGEHGYALTATDVEPTLDFALNTVRVEVGLPAWLHPEGARYRYKLDGDWSAWMAAPYIIYTNLSEGSYKLHVQAQDAYGQVSPQEATFSFVIRTPWYRHPAAYVLYVMLFAGAVFGFVKLYARKLEADKKRLEGIVRERTAEVVRQKDEIQLQKEEVTSLNTVVTQQLEDLTDSINYASRIQQALLPLEAQFHSAFPDAFILFLPRDIVSGDFYWAHRQGDAIWFAVADCTGHGVPGAFMSVMGINFLNLVVREEPNATPADLLLRLDQTLHEALQRKAEGRVNDGMDIILCRYTPANKTLAFASANRPVFIYRGGASEEIKPTKEAIGGQTVGKAFDLHTRVMQKGDVLVLSSDGFADQFNMTHKKITKKRFLEWMDQNHAGAMADCRRALLLSFHEWRGEHRQLDDVLVMGIRF